ncbi:tRNA glutamyl-Q(34) synthetase GluQRS [Microvirga rosea]|uniref:tRNA glutamyl-Q(34) synthetase GluQRS n=1 Tax=Microvirga rosea TaxID=2715425 RepID=UPI001D0A321B|nr:tRNA glutamyl-Q(34) synthetase GluQRS [Microvirga rosea]MCB8819745.1 tRNA glutamyl-Q(34) synthetase GluQRS [Microvirga rosea]
MSSTAPVFRFAPSPNGRLHLGHAYSALLNADFAARFEGRLLLRIEDIDMARCRPAFEAAIYEDLAWLGLRWEQPVRRQSEHFPFYREAAARLNRKNVLYPCFCTRKEVADAVAHREAAAAVPWPRDPDGAPLYPGTCRSLALHEVEGRVAAGEPHTLRIHMPAAQSCITRPLTYGRFSRDGEIETIPVNPARWGDTVIVRKDIPTSYHLSVVTDDAFQGITHVVRGQDLEAATDLHVLLQFLLDLPTALYHHHGLVLDPGGDKLSKSRQSEALTDLRARGITAAALRQRLGF